MSVRCKFFLFILILKLVFYFNVFWKVNFFKDCTLIIYASHFSHPIPLKENLDKGQICVIFATRFGDNKTKCVLMIFIFQYFCLLFRVNSLFFSHHKLFSLLAAQLYANGIIMWYQHLWYITVNFFTYQALLFIVECFTEWKTK